MVKQKGHRYLLKGFVFGFIPPTIIVVHTFFSNKLSLNFLKMGTLTTFIYGFIGVLFSILHENIKDSKKWYIRKIVPGILLLYYSLAVVYFGALIYYGGAVGSIEI